MKEIWAQMLTVWPWEHMYRHAKSPLQSNSVHGTSFFYQFRFLSIFSIEKSKKWTFSTLFTLLGNPPSCPHLKSIDAKYIEIFENFDGILSILRGPQNWKYRKNRPQTGSWPFLFSFFERPISCIHKGERKTNIYRMYRNFRKFRWYIVYPEGSPKLKISKKSAPNRLLALPIPSPTSMGPP